MPIYLDVITRLDERSAQASADKVKKTFADAGQQAGDAFSKRIDDAIKKSNVNVDTLGMTMVERFAFHGRAAGREFGGAFGSQMSRSIPGVAAFTSMLSGYETAAGKAGAVAGRALGLAFTGAATGLIGVAGFTLFKGFQRFEALDAATNRLKSLNQTLAASGKATVDVAAAMDTVNQVVEGTPFALDKAFSIATRALSSNTGDLRRFMTDVTDAAGFAGDDIANIGDAFLKVANTSKVSMDILNNELRNIPIQSWLAETLGKSGDEIAKMISKGQIGLEDLLNAVEQHASDFAKNAGNTIEGALGNMKTAFARTGADFLAAMFGKPTDDVNGLRDAVASFTDRIQDVDNWVKAHADDIKRMFDAGAQAAQLLGDAITFITDHLTAVTVGAGVVVTAFGAWKTISGIATLLESLETVNTLLSATLPASAAKGAAGITAALGPVSSMLSAMAASYAAIQGTNAATGDATNVDPNKNPRGWWGSLFGLGANLMPWAHERPPAPPAPAPAPSAPSADNFYKSWYPGLAAPPTPPNAPAGSPILPPSGAASAGAGAGGGGTGAPAPVFDPNMWSLSANPVAGTGFVDATSNILNARHRVEEARVQLLEIESQGNAKQSQLLAAKNKVLEAEKALQEAEAKATQDHHDKLTQLTGSMQDIGAKIDQDFGISKGLPGIAENLTKFLANLAFAPAFGQLGAIAALSDMRNGVGGGGMALGGMNPAIGFGGGFGGNVAAMMALAQTSSGRTKYGPASDLVHGLADCSGAISDLVEMLQTGQTTPGRLFDTTSFASNESAAKLGFLPGFRQGALNIGVTPLPGQAGHMAATLPNGVNFESGGATGGGAQYGGSAVSALDPQFAKQFYMPIGGGGSADVGMPWGAVPAPAVPSSPQGLAPAMNIPSAGAGGGSLAIPGLGMMPPPPQGVPQAPSGLAPTASSGEGFKGLTGLPMDALMGAASSLDVFPGAGEGAKIGIQLANRAIGYAGQLAGIGVSGLLESFLPHESPLADIGNSWIGRIASGIAGARPSSKNTAGKSTLKPKDDNQKQPGEEQPQNAVNNQITINNNNATEDGNGRDIAHHQMQEHMRPGPR